MRQHYKAENANPDLCMLILAHKVTRAELAEKIGRDRATLWRWLTDPDLDPARKMVLEKAIHEIIGGRA